MSESIQINNETLTVNKIWYVETNGNDTTGDGSNNNPYKTIYKTVQMASNNDAIMIGEGNFEDPYRIDSPGNLGLQDLNKSLYFVGIPNKTIYVCDGREHSMRDHHIISTENSNTKIFNIIFNNNVGDRSNRYEVAICGNVYGSEGNAYNCVFINIGQNYNLIYDNNVQTRFKFYNCSFIGTLIRHYTGIVILTDCVFEGPIVDSLASAGSNYGSINYDNCAFNVIYDDEYNITNGIENKGVYGGPYTWITKVQINSMNYNIIDG